MLGVFSEFERAIIVERVRSGIARAKAQGKHCGRPRLAPAVEQAIRADLEAGIGLRVIARTHGVGHAAIQRIRGLIAAE
jgi:DNA invertase Pin-like site-specific DNA recombinase